MVSIASVSLFILGGGLTVLGMGLAYRFAFEGTILPAQTSSVVAQKAKKKQKKKKKNSALTEFKGASGTNGQSESPLVRVRHSSPVKTTQTGSVGAVAVSSAETSESEDFPALNPNQKWARFSKAMTSSSAAMNRGEDEDGWTTIPTTSSNRTDHKRKSVSLSIPTYSVPVSTAGAYSLPDTQLTKKQRQNKRKAELIKAQKEEARNANEVALRKYRAEQLNESIMREKSLIVQRKLQQKPSNPKPAGSFWD